MDERRSKDNENCIKQTLQIVWQKLKRGILHVFTASVLVKIISMMSNMVLTRMLIKNEYGIISYAGNMYSYATLITGLGLAVGALQFGTENRGKPMENSYYRYCAIAGVLTNCLIIAVLTILILPRELSIAQAKKYTLLYLPLLLIEYLTQLMMMILRSQKRFKTYARVLIIRIFISFLGTCIGVIWGINGVFTAKYVVSLLELFVIGWPMRGTLRAVMQGGRLSFQQKKELWRYSIINNISSTLNSCLFLIDLSMVAALLASAEAIAVYKVATLIPNALSFIPQSIVICVVPDIIAHNKNSIWLKSAFKRTFIGMLLFNVFICLCLGLGAPLIIEVIAGKQYLAAVKPFRILLIGYSVAGTFRSLSVNFLAALKKVKGNAICSLLSCIIDIILNLLLIPKYGMLGAAFATFLAELVASLLTFGYLMYTSGVKRNCNQTV